MDAAPSGEPSCVSSHENSGAAAGLRPWHLSQLTPPSPKGHERAPQAGKRGVGRHNATRAGARREGWMGFVQSCMSYSASGQELSGELARPTARCGEAGRRRGRERRGLGRAGAPRERLQGRQRERKRRAARKDAYYGKAHQKARRHKILRGGGDRNLAFNFQTRTRKTETGFRVGVPGTPLACEREGAAGDAYENHMHIHSPVTAYRAADARCARHARMRKYCSGLRRSSPGRRHKGRFHARGRHI